MSSILAAPSGSRRASRSELPTSRRGSVVQSEAAYSKSILQIAKQLKSNCDKILDRSVPFLIDASLLFHICDAVNQVTTNQVPPQDTTQEYEDQLLFLADFFEQTPSLVIVLSEPCVNLPGGCLDLTAFRSLEFLELRKVSPLLLQGLHSRRCKLRRLKCSRNIDTIDELLQVCSSDAVSVSNSSNPMSPPPTVTTVWSELREIDFSFNRISTVDTSCLQCTPALEILNLSRNRITSIDSSLSRILQTLTILNLNFNQLTCVPPTPPNLKVLLLSNNYIPTLLSRQSLPESLEMLDLSQNVVSDEREIESLRRLFLLKNLALIGNPITYSSNYRKLVSSHLCRSVLKSKTFLLDQKRLSTSEVRFGLASVVRPPPVITPPHFLCRSISTALSAGQNDRLADLRSLTQSIDSSSSSLRSACRKKAKIRELVILDSDDPKPEVEVKVTRSRLGRTVSRLSSDSSSSSIEEVAPPISEEAIKSTAEALQSIRKKYGEEFWLFRQAGEDVRNLLNIETSRDNRVKRSMSFSRSLPHTTKDASFYSALSEWELSSTNTVPICQVEEPAIPRTPSDESIKPIDDELTNSSSDGTVFYPCRTESYPDSPDSSPSESLYQLEVFEDASGRGESFRTFETGIAYQMTILDNFLYLIDPSNGNSILSKWDLKSLKSLREEKRYEETESVHFELCFDTRRKHLQQKYCVMPLQDFRRFQERTNGFLQARTLQEFGEGFQCAKCEWEFSRGMANKTVVVKDGKVPEEVPVCPNPVCQSELLIPLDGVSLEAAQSPPITIAPASAKAKGWGVPRMTSSPIIGGFSLFSGGKSLPSESKFPASEIAAQNSYSCQATPNSQSPSNTINSDSNKKEPKSESDIETLSCDDSSSIEILPTKTTSSSGSDVAVVEEALELDMPEIAFNAAKTLGPPMTDSTSSGSCTGSICTQYEKTITGNSSSVTQVTSLASIPFVPLSQPIRYDYEKVSQVDHRLMLYCDLTLFKHPEERLLALTKVMAVTLTGNYLVLVIFSNKKIYFCKIVGPESDKVESWVQSWKNFHLSRLSKLEVLIGRQGLGLDFSGHYFGLIFGDSGRTSTFIEFFFSDICGEFEEPPLVQDFSQTQKTLMSPTNPIAYFGILRKSYCRNVVGSDKTYSLSAVVVTSEELILVGDLTWLVNRTCETVSTKHVRELGKLRQVECLEADITFVRLVFQVDGIILKWEVCFETDAEKRVFLSALQGVAKEVPFISLSEPRLP